MHYEINNFSIRIMLMTWNMFLIINFFKVNSSYSSYISENESQTFKIS